jgi:SAM-dependent methyltransferase
MSALSIALISHYSNTDATPTPRWIWLIRQRLILHATRKTARAGLLLSYDLVLCTQVLERCENPQAIVDECHRALKPGGTLILTVPSVYPVHGYPADNWRFMPDGLRHLLRAFAEVEVLRELDFAESLASVNCHYGHVFTGRMGRLGPAINPL